MMPCVIPWPKAGRDIRIVNTAATVKFELLKLIVSTALLPSLGLSASGGVDRHDPVNDRKRDAKGVENQAQNLHGKDCPMWCRAPLRGARMVQRCAVRTPTAIARSRNLDCDLMSQPGSRLSHTVTFLNRLLASVRIAVSSNRQFVPARETNVTTACRADWATIHSIGRRRDLLRRTKNKSKRLRQGGVHSKLRCRGVPGESGVPIERNHAAPRRAT